MSEEQAGSGPMTEVWYSPDRATTLECGTIVIPAGGCSKGGIWDGTVSIQPDDPAHEFWSWILRRRPYEPQPPPEVILSSNDIRRLEEEHARGRASEFVIDPAQIRERFKLHVGEERYADFVKEVPSSHEGTRLRYWMERDWDRFEAANPDCRLDFRGVVEVFADCPDHGSKVRRERYLMLVGSWLTGVVAMDELERQHGFGEAWTRLKERVREGDELHWFRSPPESWKKLRGREGIALVRDGAVIDLIVTALN